MSDETTEYYALFEYTADGETTEYEVPFPYLYINNVHVYLDDSEDEEAVYPVISETADDVPDSYTIWWTSDSTIKFLTAPDSGTVIRIQRITNRDEAEVIFKNSAILNEEDLNLIVTQLLYIVQEAYDNLNGETAVAAADRAEAALAEVEALLAAAPDTIQAAVDELYQQILAVLEALVERAETAANLALLTNYISGLEMTYTVEENLEAGTTLTLPTGMSYLAQRYHLRISVDGIVLSHTHYEEVGEDGEVSSTVTFLMPLYEGQEICYWLIPLGEAGEILTEIRTESAEILAELQTLLEAAQAAAEAAATSEDNAAASELNAATSESNAATSAAGAASSADEAAASADEAEETLNTLLEALADTDFVALFEAELE